MNELTQPTTEQDYIGYYDGPAILTAGYYADEPDRVTVHIHRQTIAGSTETGELLDVYDSNVHPFNVHRLILMCEGYKVDHDMPGANPSAQ